MHHSNQKSLLALSLAAMTGLSSVNVATAFAQSPHVHGAAAMNLVLEGKQLFVEFEAPLASVVGFEYQPQSRVEKMKLKKAVNALESGSLFEFGGAECELVNADVKTPWPEAIIDEHDHDEEHDHEHDEEHDHEHDEEHDHEHDEEHDHEHDEEHDHEHDEEHDHEHDEEHDHDHEHDHEHDEEHDHEDEEDTHKDHSHENHDHETHSDIKMTYEFNCSGKIESVKLGFFNHFALMENIKVQWITDAGQGAETLSAKKSAFDL